MGAIQNAINRTLVLGGAATAARKKDLQDELEGAKSLAQSSQDALHAATKMYNEAAKKPESSNNANDDLHKSGTELINTAANIGKTQGIKGIKEQIGNLNYYKDKNDEETKRQMANIVKIKQGEQEALQANKARSLLQKIQQNNQNSEMKKALKQYQYNLARSKRGG